MPRQRVTEGHGFWFLLGGGGGRWRWSGDWRKVWGGAIWGVKEGYGGLRRDRFEERQVLQLGTNLQMHPKAWKQYVKTNIANQKCFLL